MIGIALLVFGWTAIELTRRNSSQPLWSIATERFASALNFGGRDDRRKPSQIARLLAAISRRRN
jgi:hypothetical protein